MLNLWLLNSVRAVPLGGGKGIDSIPPIYRCPEGYNSTGGGCTSYDQVAPELVCAKGADLVNGHCLTTEKSEAIFQCPPGATQHKDKKCLVTEEAVPEKKCKKGYHTDGLNCIMQEFTDFSRKCPKDFKFSDGSCFKHEKCKEGLLTCPLGYVLEGKTCHQYKEYAPILDCKKGELQGMECIEKKHEQPEMKCPKEYKLEGHICVGKKKHKADKVCVTGELHDKECIYELTQPPIFTCKKDYQLIQGKCVQVKEENPGTECPKDYKLGSNGQCVNRIKEKPKEVCESGIYNNGECVTNDTAMPDIYCKKGHLTPGGTCQDDEKHGLELKCPKDSKMDNGICMQTIKTKPNEICDDNTIIVEAEIYCKKGELDANGQCVSTSMEKPKKECPKGFKFDGNRCLSEVEVDGHEICPEGTISKAGKCEISLKAPPQLLCKGKDYALTSAGVCSKVTSTKGWYECPAGYELSGGACVRENVVYLVDDHDHSKKHGHH